MTANCVAQPSTKIKKSAPFQLDMLDQLRAFKVIALTDKITQSAKLVALNALAHYNSNRGFSYPSLATIAEECGYSRTSTKTVAAGLKELEKVGAFKVVRSPPQKGSGKSKSNHCCPIMPWFRKEYDHIRKTKRWNDGPDEFEEVRNQNRPVSTRDQIGAEAHSLGLTSATRQGAEPCHIGSSTVSDGVHNPMGYGSEPNEENRLNRTDRIKQTEENYAFGDGPVVSLGLKAQANDNAEPTPSNGKEVSEETILAKFEDFWKEYPRSMGRENALEEFRKIALSRKATSSDIMRGLRFYKRTMPEPKFIPYPANWLKKEGWKEFNITRAEEVRSRSRGAI